ncbi:MAG: YceI family protein [Bacteroidia bacterium]|jgi:polyisoprenoid-binding protein YceI
MKKHFSFIVLLAALLAFPAYTSYTYVTGYSSSTGTVRFTTKGPLGLIKAESKKLSGSFDPEKKTFALTIPVASFEGFQNQLQKKHYNEKYMESEKIPNASFKGKVIEDIDFKKEGSYAVRAKGMMNIHGVSKEIIVKSKMTVKNGQILVESIFTVLLGDYDIKIPTIVSQQVDENILVEVSMLLSTENK